MAAFPDRLLSCLLPVGWKLFDPYSGDRLVNVDEDFNSLLHISKCVFGIRNQKYRDGDQETTGKLHILHFDGGSAAREDDPSYSHGVRQTAFALFQNTSGNTPIPGPFPLISM